MVRVYLPLLVFFGVSLNAQQYVITTIAGGTVPPTPIAALQASIGDPPRVATDPAGNLYFGSLHSLFKVDTKGALTRLAGNGQTSYTGDGGPASAAQLNYPAGIAIDSTGIIYVADRGAHVVRAISPSLTITTVAGTGLAGFLGDGGPATKAQLSGPIGVAVDAAGNLYIADTGNNAVRKVSTNGVITTVAGNGTVGFSGDGGPATAAALNSPEGLAIDNLGALYIADTFNNRVRVITPAGTIQTAVGTGSPDFADDTAPTNATVFFPADVATDANGNLYVADLGNSRIRKVGQNKIVTIAGGTGGNALFENAVATAIHLNGPTGLAVDGAGNVFFAEGGLGTGTGHEEGDFRIWKVNSGGVIGIAAGDGMESFSGDGGPAATAQINAPAGVALDGAGNLYFADTANNRVRKISPTGAITTVAGTSQAGFSGDGGSATAAKLNGPRGLALDLDGNLYIADTNNNRIRKVLPNGLILSIVGNGNAAYFGDGLPANSAAIHAPQGVIIDKAQDLYIADTFNHRVRKALPNGTVVTVAGTGVAGAAGDGGPAVSAQLNFPTSLALDAAGNLFVTDAGNGSVRQITPAGAISTAASGFSVFTINPFAPISGPQAVAADNSGHLYVTDAGANRVRVVSNGGVTTLAGNGVCCYSGDGGPALIAQLNTPFGLAVDSVGRLYVADSGNNSIRLIQPAASGSVPSISAVANGASNAAGAIAAGEIVVIFGVNLGPGTLVAAAPGSSLPQSLSGVTVLFNGASAGLLYVSAGQISAIVPAGVSGSTVQVAVQYLTGLSNPFTVGLTSASPAIFTTDSTGHGQAVALNADGTVNSPANPAQSGTTLTLLANGVQSQFLAGALGVTIAGTPVNSPVSSGTTATPGLATVSFAVPHGIPPGPAVLIQVNVGAVSSQAGVTVALTGN